MALDTTTTLRQKPVPELEKLLRELRDQLWSKQVDLQRGKVKNIREVRDIRKQVAKILTLLQEKKTI